MKNISRNGKIILVMMCLIVIGNVINLRKPAKLDTLNKLEVKNTLKVNQQALMGIWINDIYKSVPAGITYKLPDNGVKKTEDEIKALMGIKSNISFGEEEFLKRLAKTPIIIGAKVQDNATGDNIVIRYENLTLTDKEKIKEEDYIKTIENEIKKTKYNSYAIGVPSTAIICGETYRGLPIRVKETSTEQSYYIRKVGTYMIEIVATSYSGNSSNLMNGFQLLPK